MSGVKVYKPLPYRPPNKLKGVYDKPFDDGAGHTGTATYVDYYDNKNKLIEGYFLRISWN